VIQSLFENIFCQADDSLTKASEGSLSQQGFKSFFISPTELFSQFWRLGRIIALLHKQNQMRFEVKNW